MGADLHQTIERMQATGIRLALVDGCLRIDSTGLLRHDQRKWIRDHEDALIETLTQQQEREQWLDDLEVAEERFNERAANAQYDGGLDRATAEAEARKALRHKTGVIEA